MWPDFGGERPKEAGVGGTGWLRNEPPPSRLSSRLPALAASLGPAHVPCKPGQGGPFHPLPQHRSGLQDGPQHVHQTDDGNTVAGPGPPALRPLRGH